MADKPWHTMTKKEWTVACKAAVTAGKQANPPKREVVDAGRV